MFDLKYELERTNPNLNELKIDEQTGLIQLNAPINSTIQSTFDRIDIKVKVYQKQKFGSESLYLSSIVCSATIYIDQFNELYAFRKEPYFISNSFKATVERESVSKTKPLIKIDAISMNPNNMIPIRYSILNEEAKNMFVIDSAQGYIYPRSDYSLEPKTYNILVTLSF
jgi:hypothetical protein